MRSDALARRWGGCLGRCRIKLGDVKFAAALDRPALTGEVDDQTAHDPRGVAHEAIAVRKYRLPIDESQIGLVQQRGRTHGHAGIGTQLSLGELMQLRIQGGEQPLVGCGEIHRVIVRWRRSRLIIHDQGPMLGPLLPAPIDGSPRILAPALSTFKRQFRSREHGCGAAAADETTQGVKTVKRTSGQDV